MVRATGPATDIFSRSRPEVAPRRRKRTRHATVCAFAPFIWVAAFAQAPPAPAPAQLTVRMFVEPTGDPGLFSLTIDQAEVANNMGNGALFGPQPQSAGLHVIGQSGVGSTDARGYTTLYGGDCSPDGSINLNLGDAKTCTITNSRGAQTILPTDTVGGLAVGKTDGAGSVNDDGAAVYSIPIWVPPGRAGIQPQLSLVYNSRSGNGLEGVGWALTGLSEITRCPRTFLQDGEAKEITFIDGDQGDGYCLNGQRLVAVGGTNGAASAYGAYGADGTEYRTENDMHVKIVSYAPDAYGPTYFRVFMADGRILTLGTGTGILEGQRVNVTITSASPWGSTGWAPPTYNMDYTERVRYGWYLSRMEDRSGNYLTLDYSTLGSAISGYQLAPIAIHYTGSAKNSALLPVRHVSLTYEPRTDFEERYIGGFHLIQVERLHSLQMSWGTTDASNPTIVRTYTLNYSNSDSISGRSLLTSIQECDGGQICKPPTKFEWSSGDLSFRAIATNAPAGAGSSVGDIDGDGLDDILVGGATFYRSTGNGFAAGIATNFTPPNVAPNSSPILTRLIDLDARGAADVAWLTSPQFPASGPGVGIGPGYYVYKNTMYFWNSSGFQSRLDLANQVYNGFPRPDYWLDLTGDGRPDAMQPGPSVDLFGNSTNAITIGEGWQFRLNKPDNPFGPYSTSNVPPGQFVGPYDNPGLGHGPQLRTLALGIDLNGSGRSSLLVSGAGSVGPYAVTYYGGTLHTTPTTFLGEDYGFCDPILVDLNGDGLLDWVSVSPKGGGVLNVSINTGNGFAQPIQWTAPAPYNSSPSLQCDVHNDTGMRAFDYKYNGHQDLLMMGGFTPPGSNWSPLFALEWTGAGFNIIPLAIPAGASNDTTYLNPCSRGQRDPCGIGNVWGNDWSNSQVMDLDGHGLGDLLQVDSGTFTYNVWIRQGTKADLLTDVIDGFGVSDHFDYSPLIDNSVYQPGTDCKYPQLCVKRGMWVVLEHATYSRSSGFVRASRYSYRDGRIDVSGRGWIGFAQVTEREAARKTSVLTTYDNATRVGNFYPCASEAVEIETDIQTNETTHRVTRSSQKCQVVTQNKGQTYFAYPASRVTTEWEGVPGSLALLSENSDRNQKDDFGNLTAVETEVYDIDAGQPTGRSEQIRDRFAYDNFEPSWLIGQLARSEQSTVDRDGRVVRTEETYEYQPDTGLLSKILREPSAQFAATPNASDFYLETRVERNVYGQPASITSSGSGQVRTNVLTYDHSESMFVESVTDSMRHTSRYTYEPSQGLLASTADVNGVSTQYRYDGFGRSRFVLAPDGADEEIHYLWDSLSRPETSVRQSGGTILLSSFDGQRRPLAREWLGFGANWASSETGYDRFGRVVSLSLPHFLSDAPVLTSFTYDNMDRLTSARNPDNSTATRTYQGLRTNFIDPNSNRSYVLTDGVGRTRISAILDSNSREVITRFSYNPLNLLERITDAYGNVTSLEYDRLGRRTSIADSDTGVTVTHYDAFHDAKDQVDGAGRATAYVRDLLGRIRQINSPEGATTLTWDTSPNGIGKLASSASPDGMAMKYFYDPLSRLQKQTWQINGSQFAFGYAYDSFGRPWTITYPAVARQAFVLQRNYTNQGELQSISDVGQQHVYWTAAARNAAKEITSEMFGNGVATTRTYDPKLRLRSITTLQGTNPLQCIEYGDDPSDNVTSRDMSQNSVCNTPQGPNLSASLENTPVDWANRIAGWSSPHANWDVTFRYDDIGNLTEQTGSVIPVPPDMNYTYGANGAGVHAVTQITSGSTVLNYKYDPVGNQITAPSRQIRFTSFNLPSLITSGQHHVTYKYDGFHNRTLKQDTTNNRSTTYVNGVFEQRAASGAGNAYVLYLPTDDRIIGEILVGSNGRSNQTFYYFHDDFLGSIDTVSDASGNGIERFSYSPFGAKRSQLPASGQPDVRLGFTGAEEDNEFGLVNLGGRIYDPQIGRFLSVDPLVSNVYSGQSGNRYSYVLNNAMTFTDPSGFEVEAPNPLVPDELVDVEEPHPYVGFRTPLSPQASSPAAPTKSSADDNGTHPDSGTGQSCIPGCNASGNPRVPGSGPPAPQTKSPLAAAIAKLYSYLPSSAQPTREVAEQLSAPIRRLNSLGEKISPEAKTIIELGGILVMEDAPAGGPVLVRVPKGASIPEIGQVLDYTQASQEALEEGSLSPTGRVSTKGPLGSASSREAAKARAAAEESGQPYTGVAGHRPDTTWTKNPVPPKGFGDYSARVNSSIGGQAGRYPIGYKPDAFILSPGITLPPPPSSIAATPTVIPPP